MARVEFVSFNVQVDSYVVQVDKARFQVDRLVFQVDSFAFQVVQNFIRIKFLTNINKIWIYLDVSSNESPITYQEIEKTTKKQPPNWKVVLCFRH